MNSKQKYDPVTIAGVVACGLAFLMVIWYNSKKVVAPAPLPPQTAISSQGTAETSPLTPVPAESGNPPLLHGIQPISNGTPGQYNALQPAPLPETEPLLLVIPTHLQASIDPAGGGITGVELEEHLQHKGHDKEDNGGKVILGHYDYPFLALNSSAAGWDLLPGKAELAENSAVRLTRSSSDGKLQVSETWQPVLNSDFEFTYRVTLKNQTQNPVSIAQLRLEAGALPPTISAKRKTRIGESSGGISYAGVGTEKVKTLRMKDVSKKMTVERQAALAVTPASWLAAHPK